MLRPFVRRLIAPLVRWSVRGAVYETFTARDQDGVYLVVADPFGVHWLRQVESLAEAADIGRNLCRMVRDHVEGVPVGEGFGECGGGDGEA